MRLAPPFAAHYAASQRGARSWDIRAMFLHDLDGDDCMGSSFASLSRLRFDLGQKQTLARDTGTLRAVTPAGRPCDSRQQNADKPPRREMVAFQPIVGS
jgi:hypothetical protein